MNHYVPKDISRYYADVIRPKNRIYYDWRHELEQEDYNNREPEHELWGACLAQGIQGASAGNKEDFRWIISEEELEIGSFRWLCNLFNLNYSFIRNLALSGKKVSVYLNFKPNKVKKFYA